MKFLNKDLIPKSVVCWQEGYFRQYFANDLAAGISIGIISLPLALAFAIASGVSPEKGLFTAIVAGFLISLLGGSRVQIGGPTGAFVVIVYEIIQRQGYDGLVAATLIGGLLIILMGIARFGAFLKFIPYPVIIGFTTGIAVIIFTSQLKDFFGLEVDKLPAEFLSKCKTYYCIAHTLNGWAFLMASTTLTAIIVLRKINPTLPGAVIAITLATAAASFFNLPVETIELKFGEIPRTLPSPSLPHLSLDLIQKIFPDAITIALLGAIESLLSAVVADSMTGYKHRSNCELFAQGIANICSIIFGGIPATGAIARTAANIRLGGKTPMAGMIHALTLLLLMMFLAPLVGKIPLAALSGVLIFIAWNMSELPHFIEVLKGQRGDALVLLITFFLTVLIDLVVAVQVGIVLSAIIFLKRMTDKTTIKACEIVVKEKEGDDTPDAALLLNSTLPPEIAVFQITGPFFYSVAGLLDEILINIVTQPKILILRLNNVPLIDETGINAIKKFCLKCRKKGIDFLISDLQPKQYDLFRRSSLLKVIDENHIFDNVEAAIAYAKKELSL